MGQLITEARVGTRGGKGVFIHSSPAAAYGRSMAQPVAMATSDKHCQTCVKSPKIAKSADRKCSQVMFDETVPVVNAREIESPPNSDDEEVVKSAMSKFNPPARHTARHDFDSESESESETEKFPNNASEEDVSPDRKPQRPPLAKNPELKRQPSNEALRKSLSRQPTQDSSDNSETDSNELEAEARGPALALSGRRRGAGVVIPAEGAYDPKLYQDLKVPADMDNIFQYIMKYTPQKIDIDYKLQPFVPEYVPAVGDIDAFIKVTTPAFGARGQPLADRVLEHIDNLGLTVLDEPAAEQSDSALLHLQLRAVSKTSSAKATVLTKKIENAEKNTKAIDRWIKDVSELHLSKPAPNVNYMVKMPDIDSLMEEWPESMEAALNDVGFPPATLDCTLSQYVDLTCGLFDIPVCGDTLNDRIKSLHVLFSLFSAVNNSQLFADREKEKGDGKETV